MASYAQQIRRRFNRNINVVMDDPDNVRPTQVKQPFDKDRERKITELDKLKSSIRLNDTIAAILSMMGLFAAVVEYENYYGDDGKPHFSVTGYGNTLRAMVTVTTLCLIGFLVRHALLSFRIYKIKYPLLIQGGFVQSKFFKYLIVEILINAVHCPPGVEFNFSLSQLDAEFVYSFDLLATNWMLLRSYLVCRLFALYSKWTGKAAEECCEPEGCDANTIFAIKAVLKDKPYSTLLIVMISSTIVFGLAIRNFERPYYYGQTSDTAGFQDYSYIWNGMWLIAVTMTTVGYGDYFPKTHMGRFVAIVACFWGVFLVSMMVVTLTVSSSFETKEAKAYDILFRLNVKQDLKNKSAKVITKFMKLVVLHKKFGKRRISLAEFQDRRLKVRGELSIKMEELKNAKALLTDYEISSEELLRQLTEKVDRDFEEIKEILLSLVALEKQLQQIEDSQTAVMDALNECMHFTNNLQDQLVYFKTNFQAN